jgi:hypothetical protein
MNLQPLNPMCYYFSLVKGQTSGLIRNEGET